MALIADDIWRVGRKYKIVDRIVTGMSLGEYITIDGPGEATGSEGDEYLVSKDWITSGCLVPMEEEDMGLVAPKEDMGLVAPNAVTQVQKPYELHEHVMLLTQCIAEAKRVQPVMVQRMLLNAINEKFRSPSYKKWFKEQMNLGRITQSDKTEMEKLLRTIRHSPRVPYAKSYRYNWF